MLFISFKNSHPTYQFKDFKQRY